MKQFDLVGSKNIKLSDGCHASFIGVIQKIVGEVYDICVLSSYCGETPAWFVGDLITLTPDEFVHAHNLLFPTDIPGHTVLRGNAYDDGKVHGTPITNFSHFNKLIEHLRNTVDTNNPDNMPDEIIKFIKINNYSERFFLQGARAK
jgi:hypothetical protein